MARLVADDREAWFFEAGDVAEEVERRRLPLGDFVVEIAGAAAVIVERKTAADVWASIRDSRHREQLARLREARAAGARVLYLIQGSAARADDVERRSVDTAVRNLMLRDGFPVWFCEDAAGCREAVFEIARRVSEHPEWLLQRDDGCGDEELLPKLAALAPRRTATSRRAVLEAMLATVPRVSNKTARAVLEHFAPCDSLEALARTARERGLGDVRVGGRRLSEAAARSLEGVLLGGT